MSYKTFVYILLAMFAFGLIYPTHLENEKRGDGNWYVTIGCAVIAPGCIGIFVGTAFIKMKRN